MNTLKTASFIALSALFISMVGCRETELPVLAEESPVTQKPAPATPSPADQVPPATGIPAPAHPSTASVPGQLRKIKWAPMDYKEFEYNAQGGLVKYNRQYNSVQGTDLVRRDGYTYAYNSNGRITSVTSNTGIRTEYTYNGDVWSEALSFDKLNQPLRKYQFQFNAKKQLTEYSDYYVSPDGNNVTPRSKTRFTYNEAGNLVRYTFFWYVESSGTFVRSTELAFSNFDTKDYPKNADSFSDEILQPLTFFVNNPGKKELLSSYAPVEYYSYTYDGHGYPTKRTTSYTYDKPLPSMSADFEY